MVLKSLSLGFYITFSGTKWGLGRTFLGVRQNLLEGSIEPFWGGRRFQGTVLRLPLLLETQLHQVPQQSLALHDPDSILIIDRFRQASLSRTQWTVARVRSSQLREFTRGPTKFQLGEGSLGVQSSAFFANGNQNSFLVLWSPNWNVPEIASDCLRRAQAVGDKLA